MKKHIWITSLVIIILTGGVVKSHSQSSRAFLKTPAYENATTPGWAAEMYKENPNVLKVDRLYKEHLNQYGFQKNIHTQNYKHWRRAIENFVQENGHLKIPSAIENKKHLESHLQNRSASKSSNDWKPLGPFETYTNNGQKEVVSWQANVYTIDQSQSDPNVVYAGTEAGGVFKSVNKGMNWFMVSQSSLIRTVRTIKVHPSDPDIVYAGDQDYIYKTIDGGTNWEIVYTKGGFGANDIAINPDNPQIVLVASLLGLYRTTDGGVNWVEVMDDTTWDVELKPGDSNTVYVLKSNPQLVRSELWKSVDAGTTFSIRENGWYASSSPDKINGGGRMTVTPADPDRIYVILVGASKSGDHGYIGIYRSSDSGESWSLTDPPVGGPYTDEHPNLATLSNTNTLQQGYYNLGIAASHEDADVLLIGCLNLWRSEDGGASFQVLGGYRGQVPWIHPDQQEIEINGTDMWIANDGGINYSTDYFATHESRKSGLNASDYWGLGSGWNEDLVVGGRYHNGNSAHRPSFGEGNFLFF